jgi:amphi-Trp domain-containing protein
VSDVELKRVETMSRHEAADRLAALASALSEGGRAEVALGASVLTLHVPDHVRCEVEVEIDGDEIELEVELKWSTRHEEAPAEPDPPKRGTRSARAAGHARS